MRVKSSLELECERPFTKDSRSMHNKRQIESKNGEYMAYLGEMCPSEVPHISRTPKLQKHLKNEKSR